MEGNTVKVKRLRPWVKFTAYGVVGISVYCLVRGFILPPRAHVVEFDLKAIHQMNAEDKQTHEKDR